MMHTSFMSEVSMHCAPPYTPPEQRLWQAKIVQYLQDSITRSHKPEVEKIRREAHSWFNSTNADFIETCEAANWPPEMVSSMLHRVQVMGTVPRMLKELPKKKKNWYDFTNTSKI
jgi:hypothetical protein